MGRNIERFKDADVSQMWTSFLDVVNSVVYKHTPLCKIKRKHFPAWMTKAAKRAQKYKYKMWKHYCQDKSYSNYVEYKKALNKTTQEYRTAKKILRIN